VAYLLIPLTAFAVAAVTLFSGFGLGTVLTPAFALFFPIQTAIAATAVVHLANNLFKAALVGRQAHWPTVLRFGAPAALAAIAGAGTLVLFAAMEPLVRYELAGRVHEVTPLKLVIGLLIIAFAALESNRRYSAISIPSRFLVLGGVLSGFFGGLSGNQGAFRSAFLLKAGLGKEAFVATGVLAAVIVDTVRLAIYGLSSLAASFRAIPTDLTALVALAIGAAFAGSFLGARLLRKVTLRTVQLTVAGAMIAVGGALAAGLV
jgi:uncharacterized membrane protein YfcA